MTPIEQFKKPFDADLLQKGNGFLDDSIIGYFIRELKKEAANGETKSNDFL